MKIFPLLAAALLTGAAMPAHAGHHAEKNIVETAVSSPDHETLVAAVKAAELVDALSNPGPFTVFAPTDDAFAKLPTGNVAFLLKPENKAKLQSVLTYHVVSGKVDAAKLVGMIKSNGGKAELTTLEGGLLTARLAGDAVVLTDEKGGQATVIAADLRSSNGIIHVTNAVSLPG